MSVRSMIAAAATGLALTVACDVSAQSAVQSGRGWELLVTGGQVVPTGEQRDAIKRGNMSAVQLSYRAHPLLAVTATAGWARSRDVATAGDPKLDVFTYDLGAEARAPRMPIAGLTFAPFAGVGAGARTYNYRKLDVDATHNAAAYGTIGGELGMRRVSLRIEARDYVTGFKPLIGAGDRDTRNDVVVLAGLRIKR